MYTIVDSVVIAFWMTVSSAPKNFKPLITFDNKMYESLIPHNFLTYLWTKELFFFSLQLHPRCTTLEPCWHSQMWYLSFSVSVSCPNLNFALPTCIFRYSHFQLHGLFLINRLSRFNNFIALHFRAFVTTRNYIIVADFCCIRHNFFWTISVLHNWMSLWFFLADKDEIILFSYFLMIWYLKD